MADGGVCAIDRNTCFVFVFLAFGAICLTISNEKQRDIKPYRFMNIRQHAIIRQNTGISREDLPLCSEKPANLVTKVNVSEKLREIETNLSILQHVLPGGTYKPPGCKSRERLAVLVPYRDRAEHLKKFLPYMHAFLQKQQVHYTIFVAEMVPGVVFNTGLLQNVAFATADKFDNFTCFVVNDVDLLPTNENNFYRCADVPKHLCHSNSKYKYNLLYPRYFGGSLAMRRDHFIKVNGYSNLYFGWGSQDDDMLSRIEEAGYKWMRIPKNVGVYDSFEHGQDTGNPYNHNRGTLNKAARIRMRYEGLNSLKYKQVAMELRDLYTWVNVTVNQTEITQNYTQYYPDQKGPR